MGTAYTTSTASLKVPVVLSFNCPSCGKCASVNKTALLSVQATMRGSYSSAAGIAAKQNLAANADNQVNNIINYLKMGDLRVLLDESGRNVSGKVLCPNCGMRQIPDIPEKRRTLYPKGFGWMLFGVILAAILLCALIISLITGTGGTTKVTKGLLTGMIWLVIGAAVAVIIFNKKRSEKAYADPAYLAKHYRSVLNPHMQAVLTLGVGNTRRVDIPEHRT